MFIEQEGDAEMAELFAMGLIDEPVDNGTLILTPCRHRILCKTHGTFWIKKKFIIASRKQRKHNPTAPKYKVKL